MKKTLLLAGLAALSAAGAQAQFITEVSANPPGSDRNGGLQFFELKGLPNAPVADNVWLLVIDCGPTRNAGAPVSGANKGELQIAIKLVNPSNPNEPLTFGANGLLLLRDGGLLTNGVPVNPIVNTLRNGVASGPDPLTNVVFYNVPFVSGANSYAGLPSPSNFGDVPNDALTLMLVKGGNWAGIPDVDLNDDDTLDAGLLDGVTVLDAMSYKADGITESADNRASQSDYADEVDGFSFGLFQGTRTWEPDVISRVLNAANGGPAVGVSYDTRGWVLGDALPTSANNSPLFWDEGADEVFFFTDPRGLEENPFGRPMNYAIATPDFPNQTEAARPSPGWENVAVSGPQRTVSGRIDMIGISGAGPTSVNLELRYVGIQGSTIVTTPVRTDGAFTADVPMGVYSVAIKPQSYLTRVFAADTRGGNVTSLIASYLAGDIDGDNSVTVFDYDKLSLYFDKSSTDADWSMPDSDGIQPKFADLDGDTAVTVFDYDLLSTNFDLTGE